MRLSIRIALLATVGLLFIGLIPAIQIIYRMEVPRRVELREITKITRLKFPARATLLGSNLQDGTDWSIQVAAKMKQTDVSNFIASAKREYILDEAVAFHNTEKHYRRPKWWMPYTANQFHDYTGVSRHFGTRGQAHIRIVTDSPQYSVVYLDWTGKP